MARLFCLRIFEDMHLMNEPRIRVENLFINSVFLQREVEVDFFLPVLIDVQSEMSLLLINDGQNLAEMDFRTLIEKGYASEEIRPLICVGIYAGKNRMLEYGVAAQPDYLGRGSDAGLYTSFLLEELLPFISKHVGIAAFEEKAIAGFSLGGLMALDIVWNHPSEFTRAGVFSGSFWWRSLDQYAADYDDELHRIMQQKIRSGTYQPGLGFFFQCGNMDETMDRNNNGIIDSIDDTMAVIGELEAKGYLASKDIHYLEMPDGKHDLPTWKRAMPEFIKWGWGITRPDGPQAR